MTHLLECLSDFPSFIKINDPNQKKEKPNLIPYIDKCDGSNILETLISKLTNNEPTNK